VLEIRNITVREDKVVLTVEAVECLEAVEWAVAEEEVAWAKEEEMKVGATALNLLIFGSDMNWLNQENLLK